VCVDACHLWIKAGFLALKKEKAQLWRQDEISPHACILAKEFGRATQKRWSTQANEERCNTVRKGCGCLAEAFPVRSTGPDPSAAEGFTRAD